MTSFARACVGLLALGSALAFAGCGDDDDASPGGGGSAAQGGAGPDHGGESSVGAADGVAECQVIGELCHEADTGAGAAHECHELGHEGDGAACVAGFADCVETCVEGSAGKEPLCAALGELCHAVDDETGPLHECHELGHVNDQELCAAEFSHCATICLAAREELEHGAGTGGGATGGAGTGGVATGGAATGGAP
jgi:hypothetical protein